MKKQIKEYLMHKHESLNMAMIETRDKNLSQLADMVNNKNIEIDKLENKLKWLTFGFFLIIAVTIIAGIVLTILSGVGLLIGGLSTATGFTSELSLYFAMTKDIQSRLSDLRHQRDKVEDELVISSKEISKTLIDEQRAITTVLTKENIQLPAGRIDEEKGSSDE